jgi:hypothetical protein
VSRFGIDYAWGTPNVAGFKAAGVSFVCRYISTPGNSKNISAGEARTLSNGGIDIVLVFETTAGRATAGKSAGAADARSARSQAAGVGMPSDRPLYFAVDFDTAGNPSKVDAYFDGVASVLGKDKSGPYGSYEVVKHLLDRGFKYGWQTYAWSRGQWDSRAQLQQYSNDHTLAGVSCDYDRGVRPDFGQWRIGWSPKPESRKDRKIHKWQGELDQIRKYVHDKGDGWRKHPIRWARAKALKRILKKYGVKNP